MKEDKAVDKIMEIIAIKKVCSGCGEEKNISEFHKDKYKKDGIKSRCKVCNSLCDKENNKNKKIKAIEIKNNEYKITLDFSKVKFGIDLLSKLKHESEESLRTLENEIFFMLKDIIR